MKITYPNELIGEEIEVINSPNKSLRGIRGKVIDETKETLKIQIKGKVKMIIKSVVTIKLSDGKTIEGKMIDSRSEERLKGK